MVFGNLQVSDDVSAGAWIAPRLEGGFGAVTQTVPSGFAAYVRVCHPPTDPDGRLATWSAVARRTGRQAHPSMQWHALVGSADALNVTGSLWPGEDPRRGNLVAVALSPLCDALAAHTSTPERCLFCLWEGWGWIHTSFVGPAAVRAGGADAAPASSETADDQALSAEDLSAPRLRLPDRDYLLLAGPLRAALQIGHRYGPKSFVAQSPTLFWPADRAWCVATEIDFDSTLLGGTTEVVDAILQAPELDAWPVGPDDSLAHDADRLNPVP